MFLDTLQRSPSAPGVFPLPPHLPSRRIFPPPTMSHQDLADFAPAQTAKINENASCFIDAGPHWTLFKDSLWGMGPSFLELSPRDLREILNIQDVDPLPDITPTTYPVVEIPETMPDIWDLRGQQHLLVRSEYKEAENAALLANSEGCDLFLVTGQPGIGTPISHSIVTIHRT